MTLDEVLTSRNIEGRIYLWDVRSYFGLDIDKAEELRTKLEEIMVTKTAKKKKKKRTMY